MAEVQKMCFERFQNIRDIIENGNVTGSFEWKRLLGELEATTILFKIDTNRQQTTEVFYTSVLEVLRLGSTESTDETDDVKTLTATECYRCLRNSCVNSPRNQLLIHRQPAFLETTLTLCNRHLAATNSHSVVLLRCAVQFLGNLAVGNPQTQLHIFNQFSQLFCALINYEDEKLPHYTCMLLHTCLASYQGDVTMVTDLVDRSNGDPMMVAVLNAFQKSSSEWILFVIEDLLKIGDVWKPISCSLNIQQKHLLLEVAIKLIGDSSPESAEPVSVGFLQSVVEDFIRHAHSVLCLGNLTTGAAEDSENAGDSGGAPVLVVRELDVLCVVTSDPHKYAEVRTNKDLLSTAINLLHGITAVGKTSSNAFSSVKNIRDEMTADEQSPAHGLKRDLIRLIGNLAYRNTANQDLVRELDGLPLILDHTDIDERNPFITQWSVFAVRNLCEGNPANRAVLEGLKMEGIADNTEMLRDFGVRAEQRGDKIIVKPDTDP